MKKMRKLLPAFAMLLVSAIMMSTASFAWFTMNETVTATGMQIQAQAAGSLVIKENSPLKFNDTKSTVTFTSGVSKLSPITLGTDGVWKAPTAANNVDPHTGLYEGALSTVVPQANTDYVEKVIFIASAGGDLEEQKLIITLGDDAHPADSLIYKAYSAAIYVVEKGVSGWDVPGVNAEPAAILHNLTGSETVTLDKGGVGYTIPSIAGIEDDANAVGIKIVIRFFVDGDLDANGTDTMQIPATVKHTSTAGSKLVYDNTKNYFNADNTPFNATGYENGVTEMPEGVYWVETTTEATTNFKYVNSDDIPVAYTSMFVSIEAGEV